VFRILLSSIRFFLNWKTMSQQNSKTAPMKPRVDSTDVYYMLSTKTLSDAATLKNSLVATNLAPYRTYIYHVLLVILSVLADILIVGM